MAFKRLTTLIGVLITVLAIALAVAIWLPRLRHFYKPETARYNYDKGAAGRDSRRKVSSPGSGPVVGDVNQAGVRERLEDDVRAGHPLAVHVVVALCDNKHQSIVPVPQLLGNGRDARNNLYWGAMYGVRTFLTRNADWKVVAEPSRLPEGVLEKVVLHTIIQHSGRDVHVYLVAEAWDGKAIKSAIERFMRIAAGHNSETVRVKTPQGPKDVQVGGAAHLVVYVGHNGLMDFLVNNPLRKSITAQPRSAVVLACKSKSYFLEQLRQAGAHILLVTTGFMAPEAYTLDAVVRSWAAGQEPYQVRDKAASAYHRYQKCGLKAAKQLFFFEPYCLE